jgi:DNA-directed RNA polymerase specialized sigma24 family protein
VYLLGDGDHHRRISELDGTPVGTVKTPIRNALLKLRGRLEVEDETA